MRIRPALVSGLLLLTLSGCGLVGSGGKLFGKAERPVATGPHLPADVEIGALRIEVPVGRDLGGYRIGLDCELSFDDIPWLPSNRSQRELTDAVTDGLARAGLTVTPRAGRVLTGRVVDINIELCRNAGFFNLGRRSGDTGEGRVRIEWELTDPAGHPYNWATEGEGSIDGPTWRSLEDYILAAATADAAQVLGQQQDFRELVTGGRGPGVAVPVAAIPPRPAALPAVPVITPDGLRSPPAEVLPGEVPVEAVEETEAPSPATPVDVAAALVRWGNVVGVVVEASGLVLLPDTGAPPPDPVPLTLPDGREVTALKRAQAFGFYLLSLPEGTWPSLPVRRQRPGVSHWLRKLAGEGAEKPVAMVAAHAGPPRGQGGQVALVMLDLDQELWRNPPWILLDDEGRLAALRGPKALPGDLQPYYAPGPVMAYFKEIAGHG